MARYYHYLLFVCAWLLAGCQTIEQLSIDYMVPAEVSFPPSLRRVAVVNNMPSVPENKLIASEEKEKKDENEVARTTNYYNGDAVRTTEALAEALAEGNYFDEVVICDSALRSKDIQPREGTLMSEEVNELIQSLDVDFLIALENIQMSAVRKINYLREWSLFHGTVDVKVYPTVKVYLPNRKGPMVTINANDSIFWEEAGNGESYVRSHLIKEDEMIRQASDFAGTVPVKHLLPYWKQASRYLICGGSVNMRDAAVYAREANWEEAVNLWKKEYDSRKKGKKKAYAAYNIAVGYEMQDSIADALEWALKAQAEATSTISKENAEAYMNNATYVLTSIYVGELQKRQENLTPLNGQMKRFDDDF